MSATRIPVQIKIVDPRLVTEFGGMPRPATSGAAACDVVACAVYPKKENGKPDMDRRQIMDKPFDLYPGETAFIGLGFAMHIMNTSYAAILIPRSGVGAVSGIVLAHSQGLLDSDYTGEFFCPLLNRNKGGRDQASSPFTINPGDRIAQFYLTEVAHADWEVVEEFSAVTGRGAGAFGSTGTGRA